LIRHQRIRLGASPDDTGYFLRLAMIDIIEGVYLYRLWMLMAWQDIRQRYRRSVLGPFWLTISTGIMVGALGFLYAGLFNQPLSEYLPHVGAGLVVWALISQTVNDSCEVFINSEVEIKQMRLPLTVYVWKSIWRNVVIFLHNSLILFCFLFFGADKSFWALITVPFAILVIALNGYWVGIFVGICCTRFRDIQPIVQSVVQVMLFVTPIMWKPEALESSGRLWIAMYNPVFHFVEIIRAPFMGGHIPLTSWAFVLSITVIGSILAFWFLTKYRHRLAYWL